MSRPKEFVPDEILERALQLFWKKGYEATSMQDLVDHLGVNRRGIYETFGDKRALYLKALRRYRKTVGEHLYDPLMRDGRGVEALVDWLRALGAFILSPAGRSGCFVTNCVTEGTRGDEAESVSRDHLEHLERSLRSALDRAADHGELKDRAGNIDRARLLLTIIEGLFVLSRLPESEPKIRSALRSAIRLVRWW